MFKKLLTALLIATACITYVCGIKLVGPAIYSDISHLYFFNSRDCKNTYICKGYGIIKNNNRGFYDCFLRNSVANYRESLLEHILEIHNIKIQINVNGLLDI